jgi:signal transduction histidine kinase/CHASE3 domain sensor protein
VSSLGLIPRMLVAAVLVAVLVSVSLAVVLLANDEQQEALGRAQAANDIAAQAGALQNDVTAIGSGARGFVLTGDPDQLEPWRQARATVEREADLLVALVADEPAAVRARAQAIAREVSAYRREYADPLVALARRDRAAADSPARQLEGRTRSRSIREQINALVDGQRTTAERAADESRDAGDLARTLAIVALVLGVLTVIGLAAYLARVIVAPVKRLAGQLARMAEGDLSVRAAGGAGEVGALTGAFNAMAGRLEEGQREIERRRVEAESQNVELEHQNVELETHRAELERALADLGEEKGRVEVFYSFGARIATETELSGLAAVTLEQLCALSGCQVGVLYAAQDDTDDGELPVAAVRGLGETDRPPALSPGQGLAGQALQELRPVQADYPTSPLRVRMLGGEVAVRHELHTPLLHGGRTLGLVSLARLDDEPFHAAELESVAHLAGQAAVAFSNLMSARSTERQASISDALFAATPVGIALTDVDGEVLLVNQRMRALLGDLGLPAEGNLLAMAEQLVPQVAEPARLAERIRTLAADPARQDREEFRLLASGHSYEWTLGSVPDGDGRLMGRVMVLRDVTAERESERLRDEFVALVSHELRTPMTAVLGYIELALDGGELDAESTELLGVAARNATRLIRLIGDLILVSQARAGRLSIEVRDVDLTQLVAEAVEAARPLADEKRLALQVRDPDGPLPLRGDPTRLRQVIDNLVSNAIKFSPAEGRVELELSGSGELVQLAVADSGPGIPPADLEQLFEPFFRASSTADAVAGTGLGLAVVRAIVEAHDGRVSVESSPAGATFLVRLPTTVPALAPVESGRGSG